MHGVTTVFGGNCGFTLAPGVRRARRLPVAADGARRGHPAARVAARRAVGLEDVRRLSRPRRGERHRGERRLPRGSLGAAAGRDGRRRGRREPPPTSRSIADGTRCCTTRSTPARWASRRRRPPRTTTATAIRCRRARRRSDELLRLAGALHSHPGTQLELIIAGCLNGFTDDEVDLMTEMSLAADRPLNWNVLGVTPGGMHEKQLDAGTRAAALGGAHRRAHAAARESGSGCRSSRASCSTVCRAGARRSRCRSPSGSARCQRSRRARPARRAGALDGSGRAREPRALGTARGRSRVHAADASAFEGRHDRRHRRRSRARQPFDALLDIVVADELRTGLRPDFGGPEPDETWKMRADVWRDPRAMIGGSDAGAHLDMMSGASLLDVRRRRRRAQRLPLTRRGRAPAHRQARAPVRRRATGAASPRARSPTSCASTPRPSARPASARYDDLPGGASRIVAQSHGMHARAR